MATTPFYRRLERRKRRRQRYRPRRPELRVSEVLVWADEFHARTGRWPTVHAGSIPGSFGDTWMAVDSALKVGRRGLPGGSTLAQLLAKHRGRRNIGNLPPLAEAQILAWADRNHERTGEWPNVHSGTIPGTQDETWKTVDSALRNGVRGLTGDSSLPRLLALSRGVLNVAALPRLTVTQVLAWADAHRARTGSWPKDTSGPINEVPDETWFAVDRALRAGVRGFRSGSSLTRVLARHRGTRNPTGLPRYVVAQILSWADAHHRRTGT